MKSKGIVFEVGFLLFFFQAEDGIRDLVRSRGLGDVYKRQILMSLIYFTSNPEYTILKFGKTAYICSPS